MVTNPDITLPSFISLAIPILKTPFFHECLGKHLILPNIKIRDLDGTTVTMKPRDSLPDVIRFVKDIQNLAGYRLKVACHSVAFYHRYRQTLSFWHMLLALYNSLLLCSPKLAMTRSEVGNIAVQRLQKPPRTYIGSTESLDPSYRPAFRIDSRYEPYFQPTILTDREGNLNDDLRRDLAPSLSSIIQISKQGDFKAANNRSSKSPPAFLSGENRESTSGQQEHLGLD